MTDERPRLTALVASADAAERQAAIEMLARLAQPWAVTLLRELLKDPLGAIRAASVDALAQRAAVLTQPTMDALVALAERDPDPETRRAAVRALGTLLAIPTAPRRHVIRRVLRAALPDPIVRSVAERALREAEGPAASGARESQRKASARRRLAGNGASE